jgi:hypothetical protein
MDDSSFLNRSRFGRLRQARRSVAPYAILRYLLLLANLAQLFPVNPGKDEQTSRSTIVLGTHHEYLANEERVCPSVTNLSGERVAAYAASRVGR